MTKQSDLSPKWRERFAFFEQYGPLKTPAALVAFKALPYRKKVLINMNYWALFFGIIYLPMLGLWRRWLMLMAATAAIIAIEVIMMIMLNFAIGWIFLLLFFVFVASSTNYAYFLKRTTGEDSYNLFIGRRWF